MGIEKQSRRMSLVEAITNVVVGFGVALLTQIIVFPLFGLSVSLGENFAIGGLFTVTSIARSYVLRRVFEAIRALPSTKTGAGTQQYPGAPCVKLLAPLSLKQLVSDAAGFGCSFAPRGASLFPENTLKLSRAAASCPARHLSTMRQDS
jgi:hypothetical protein